MSTQISVFDELEQALRNQGVPGVLETLENRFRSEQRYHELFEVLKMRARMQAGLPIVYSETPDDVSDQQRDRLEEGLLEACREVGLLLVRQGSIRDGWMYLRPVSDLALAREALAQVPVDESNIEEFIEVLLHEGVDPARGFRLVLEHYGTCNAITTFDSVVVHRSKADRQAAAGLLVKQLHRELTMSLRNDIQRQEGADPGETSIAQLVADRDWLFGDFAYHIDTTHLASVIRFARLLDDQRQLELALDMTEYGRRLSSQFQYRGEEPFADLYPSHALFFQALLGRDVEASLEYFGAKARELDVEQTGALPRETYVDLLSRVGRHREALEAALELLPSGGPSCGVAPSLVELSARAGTFDPMLDFARRTENVLAFATGLLEARRLQEGSQEP